MLLLQKTFCTGVFVCLSDLSMQDRRPRRGRGRGKAKVNPPSDEENSEGDEVDDLKTGRFGTRAVERSSTSKRLLTFLAPELKETNMNAKDQGYMVQAMTSEGFDLSLFDIICQYVIPMHCSKC